MLFGKLSPGEAVVEKVKFAPNQSHSTVRFTIAPAKVAAAFNEAEKEGLDFIGLFHSHPAPAAPSSVDLKYMKLWGDALWLILPSVDGNLAAYQLTDEAAEQVPLRID